MLDFYIPQLFPVTAQSCFLHRLKSLYIAQHTRPACNFQVSNQFWHKKLDIV